MAEAWLCGPNQYEKVLWVGFTDRDECRYAAMSFISWSLSCLNNAAEVLDINTVPDLTRFRNWAGNHSPIKLHNSAFTT